MTQPENHPLRGSVHCPECGSDAVSLPSHPLDCFDCDECDHSWTMTDEQRAKMWRREHNPDDEPGEVPEPNDALAEAVAGTTNPADMTDAGACAAASQSAIFTAAIARANVEPKCDKCGDSGTIRIPALGGERACFVPCNCRSTPPADSTPGPSEPPQLTPRQLRYSMAQLMCLAAHMLTHPEDNRVRREDVAAGLRRDADILRGAEWGEPTT